MYDYLFAFPDEATAQTVLSNHYSGGEWEQGEHDFFETKVILSEAVIDEFDNQISPQVVSTQYWVATSSDTPNEDWWAIPYCVQETLRPTVPTPVSQTIIRTKLLPEQYAAFTRVTPVFSGSAYIWGA